jgi:hypothetical protein
VSRADAPRARMPASRASVATTKVAAITMIAMIASVASITALGAIMPACGDTVVDGDCADGYVRCGAICVLADHCADASLVDAPDGADASGDSSADTATDAWTDAAIDAAIDSAPDSSSDSSSDAATDAATDSAMDSPMDSASDSAGDAPSDAAVDGDTLVDACPAPPYTTPSSCGGCGVVCSGATPSCTLGDAGSYACAPFCTAPLVDCGGVCVDTTIDPNNCGGCGILCPTGLCDSSTCRGARSGHEVIIGHDYASSAPNASAGLLVANGVFLAPANPVRVLWFDAWADPTAESAVAKIIQYQATAIGRSWTRTYASSAADVVGKLGVASYDVLLLLDQPRAPGGALATLGGSIGASIDSFASAGGIVVTLDGGGGAGEMPSFLASSGILATSGHTTVTGDTIDVVAPADAVGLDVLTPYLGAKDSVSFQLTVSPSPTLVVVAADATSSAPVVLHRVVKKP